jgi:hypothetical protein
MSAHLRCMCSKCQGRVEFDQLDDYLAAHPDAEAASRARHPSTQLRLFPDGSQLDLDGEVVRSKSGFEWRQLRLFGGEQ